MAEPLPPSSFVIASVRMTRSSAVFVEVGSGRQSPEEVATLCVAALRFTLREMRG